MKVLVTGGGGFLGGALCRGLLARGDVPISFQRRRSAALGTKRIAVLSGISVSSSPSGLAASAQPITAPWLVTDAR